MPWVFIGSVCLCYGGNYTYSRTARSECSLSVHKIFRNREMWVAIIAMARPNYDDRGRGASVFSYLYLWVEFGCRTRWYFIGISPCLLDCFCHACFHQRWPVGSVGAMDAFIWLTRVCRQGAFIGLKRQDIELKWQSRSELISTGMIKYSISQTSDMQCLVLTSPRSRWGVDIK